MSSMLLRLWLLSSWLYFNNHVVKYCFPSSKYSCSSMHFLWHTTCFFKRVHSMLIHKSVKQSEDTQWGFLSVQYFNGEAEQRGNLFLLVPWVSLYMSLFSYSAWVKRKEKKGTLYFYSVLDVPVYLAFSLISPTNVQNEPKLLSYSLSLLVLWFMLHLILQFLYSNLLRDSLMQKC